MHEKYNQYFHSVKNQAKPDVIKFEIQGLYSALCTHSCCKPAWTQGEIAGGPDGAELPSSPTQSISIAIKMLFTMLTAIFGLL